MKSASQPDLSLTAHQMTLRRGRRTIYTNVSVSFGVGATALLGPNGAGKTTLLQGLADPARAHQGEVSLNGRTILDDMSSQEFFAVIGYMPQDWKFFAGFTARETVEYAAWLKGIPSRQIKAAASRALQRVNLEEQQNTQVRRLSGGMRQRVGLAEAFVNEPQVVFLDEPTVGLDPAQRALFRDLVREYASEHIVITSTHLTDDVEAIADRVLVVDEGQVVFDGAPQNLTDRADGQYRGATAMESGYLSVIGAAARGGTN